MSKAIPCINRRFTVKNSSASCLTDSDLKLIFSIELISNLKMKIQHAKIG